VFVCNQGWACRTCRLQVNAAARAPHAGSLRNVSAAPAGQRGILRNVSPARILYCQYNIEISQNKMNKRRVIEFQ